MPTFDIESEICLGFSHSGGVYNSAYGEVELSDDEVNQLIVLMREKDSSDIEELNLEEELPEIYKKLDEAYRETAYTAEEEHWLEEGYYRNECHDFKDEDMIEFLKSKDAWHFEYDEEDVLDENGEIDQEALEDLEYDYLHQTAIDDYYYSVHGEERYDFLRNQMGIIVDPEGCDYEVKIPEAIVVLAFPEEDKK